MLAASPFKNELKETVLNEPSKEALALPYYNALPKDEIGLLQWRIYARARSIHDLKFRDALMQMSAVDPCFFIATFVDIHETRLNPRNVPFFLWTDQVDIIAWVAKDIGQRDIVISKSRGIGMSWTFAAIMIWCWMFKSGAEMAMVSKDADSLDIVGRPSTLMGKLDYIFEHLPFWMTHDEDGESILSRTHQNHKFANKRNNAVILGYVPTDQKLRGGRFFCVLFDEFAFVDADPRALAAATQHVSFCRIWLSTFNGMGNLFHRFAHDEKSPMLRLRTFWWANPDRALGMYTSKNGIIEIIDKSYPFPPDYPFVADGQLRSPFFDFEMSRAGADKQSMLEELNGVAAAATRKLFQGEFYAALRRNVRPPVWRGILTEDGEWIEDFEGPWRLWRRPGHLSGHIFIGVDPASGLVDGAYAAMVGVDAETGEQIFTYAGHEPPIDLARLANTAGRVFTGPGRYSVLNWETTGSLNGTFTHEIMRLKYPRVYQDEKGKIGYNNRDRGEALLWEAGRAVRDSELVLYDENIADELELFEFDRDGELQWAGTDGHADRSIALGIAWMAAKLRRKAVLRQIKEARRIQSQGADAEPEWLEMQRNAGMWSSQFKRHN